MEETAYLLPGLQVALLQKNRGRASKPLARYLWLPSPQHHLLGWLVRVTTSSLLGPPGSRIEALYGNATQVFNIHQMSIAHYASLTQFGSVLRWLNRPVAIRFPPSILILHFKSHATDVLSFAVLLSSGSSPSPLPPTLSYFFEHPGRIFMK